MVRAAQYVRMSTEHQRYSIECQSATNLAYALERGYEIGPTYTDAGVSGLSMRRRDGLRALLKDVLSGTPGFQVVLVYDVSRWGRFQDPDQSAHYEFLCREAGVQVVYTAEPFDNDGSLASTIVKQIKRAMAAEYSRELSVKVSTAQRGWALKGYWRGSACIYGFRRCEVGPDGERLRVMGPGERKALQGHRVVLVHGPDEEVATVRRVFREFVVHGLSTLAIARRLNAEHFRTARGDIWTRRNVRRLLCEEKYIGTLIVGRIRSRLRTTVRTPASDWIRVPNACPAIVSKPLFESAQRNLRPSPLEPRVSNERLVAELRRLLTIHGRLTWEIVKDDPDTHCPTIFHRRFGGLLNAYAAAGYKPTRQQQGASAWFGRTRPHPFPTYTNVEIEDRLKALFAREGHISASLIENDETLPSAAVCRDRFGGMEVIYRLVGHTPTKRQRNQLRSSDASRAPRSH